MKALKILRILCLLILVLLIASGVTALLLPTGILKTELVHLAAYSTWLLIAILSAVLLLILQIVALLCMNGAQFGHLIKGIYHAAASDFWLRIAKLALPRDGTEENPDSPRFRLANYAYCKHNGHSLLCDITLQLIATDMLKHSQ